MPTKRLKPVNPFIQQLLDRKGYKTLKEAAEKTGIPYTTLLNYADGGHSKYMESARKTANAFGVTLDEFVEGLMSA